MKNKIQVDQHPINILEAALLGVALSLPLWPSYLVIKVEGIPSINLTRLIIFLLMSLWSFGVLINFSYRARFLNFIKTYNKLLLFILLPFFSWKIITAGLSSSRGPAIFSALRDTVYYFLIFLISVNIWRSYSQLERVVKTLLLASVIVFFIVIVEVLMQQNLFSSFVPASFISAQKLSEGLIRDGTYRAWGTFSHPLALGCYCTTILPFAVWYTAIHKNQRRIFGFLICAALICSLFLTTSRAALVVLTFITGGYMIKNYLPGWIYRGRKVVPKKFLAFILALIILAGVAVVGQHLAAGRTEKEAGSTSIRLLQIQLGWPLIIEKPLTGYGPGEAAEVLNISNNAVDNYYLTLALESGLPEVILFLCILFYFLNLSWKLQKLLPWVESGLAKAIFWSIAGNVLFLSVLSIEQILPFVFMQFAMLISLNYKKGKNHKVRNC